MRRMRKLTGGIACGLLLAAAACNLHLDQSLLDADQATEGNLTEDAGPPTDDAGTKPASHDPTSKDAGTDAKVATDGGDAGPPVAVDNKLCPGNGVPETEPNDTPLSANSLLPGVTCGKIGAVNEADWYTFEVGADGAIKLNFDSEADGYFVLTNADSTITTNGGSGTKYAFQTTPKMRITVRVYSLSAKLPAYTLTR